MDNKDLLNKLNTQRITKALKFLRALTKKLLESV